MTLKRAYDLTRDFTKRDLPFRAGIVSDFYFKEYNGFYSLYSKLTDFHVYDKISTKVYSERYLKNKDFNINSNHFSGKFGFIIEELVGEYAITAKGLVSIDEYYLACDLMDNQKGIQQKEMNKNHIYKAITGKEYIYLGDIFYSCKPYKKDREERVLDDMVLDTKLNKIVNRTSIRLVEYNGENSKDFTVNLYNYFSKAYNTKGKLKRITKKINNIEFINKGEKWN